jgi:hypothetical protein
VAGRWSYLTRIVILSMTVSSLGLDLSSIFVMVPKKDFLNGIIWATEFVGKFSPVKLVETLVNRKNIDLI